MAVGEKIVDGAVDSVGYAAKDGLKTFLTVGLITGALLGLAVGALAAGPLGWGLGAAIAAGVIGGVAGGGFLGWLAGSVGAAWGLVTGPFRGSKERRLEAEDNPALSQGVSRQQELDALRAQNGAAREQLNAMGNEIMQATNQQQLAQQAAQYAALNGGSQQPMTTQQQLAQQQLQYGAMNDVSQKALPENGFVAQENSRRGAPNANLTTENNKKFVETLAQQPNKSAYIG